MTRAAQETDRQAARLLAVNDQAAAKAGSAAVRRNGYAGSCPTLLSSPGSS